MECSLNPKHKIILQLIDKVQFIMTKINEKPYYLTLIFSVAFIVFVVFYHKLLFANFISWDDGDVLVSNKDVHQFNLKSFFTKQYVGNYAPLTMIVFSLEWLVLKGNTMGHHFMNLLLHFFNVVLIYHFSFILFKSQFKALICAFIFCFHPLQIETIAWVSAQNNILYTLFFVSSLIMYFKFKSTQLNKYYLFTLLFFLLALLSKPSAIIFPFCLIIIELFLNGFYFVGLKKQIKSILPFLALSIIFGVITIYTRSEANFLNERHHFNIFEKIGNAGFALVFYCWKFMLPIKLSVIYGFPKNSVQTITIGYVFIILLFALAYRLVKTKKHIIIFGILFFIINLLLVLQFISFGEVLNADRYMYLPILGIAILIAHFINIQSRFKQQLTLVLICLPLCFLSFYRTNVWQNSTNLYSDILKNHPHSYEALSSIGVEYMLKNDTLKAMDYLSKAIKEYPDYYKSHYNRGLLFARMNQPQNALKDLTIAINQKKYIKAYTARAAVYYQLNDINNALLDANKALTIDKENANANFILANCYNDLNDLINAETHYNKAIKLQPEDPNIYLKRAILYGKKQNFNACLTDLNQSIYLNSSNAESYYWRGVAKFNLNINPCDDLKKSYSLGFKQAESAIKSYCK